MNRADQLRAEFEARRKAFEAENHKQLWDGILQAAVRAQEAGLPVVFGGLMAGCTITLTPPKQTS